ncbi:TPA: DUF550 domain-containing protein [Raoultella planticola]
MTSKLTRERIELIANFHRAMTLPPSHDEIEELARLALAAMGSEPVGTFRKSAVGYTPSHHEDAVPLYAAPQLSPERDQVRREHADWSQATFGNVGPVGPLKHLSKEALEAAAEPDDLSEWADMQFLLWDAQRRAGITDEQITLAMIEKLAVNKQREWPEPKDGEPRLHIKAQPAPVVPEEIKRNPETGWYVGPDGKNWSALQANSWNACRAAMLHAGNYPVIPDGLIAAVNRLLDSDGSRGCYSAIRFYDARAEVERLLAAAPQEAK